MIVIKAAIMIAITWVLSLIFIGICVSMVYPCALLMESLGMDRMGQRIIGTAIIFGSIYITAQLFGKVADLPCLKPFGRFWLNLLSDLDIR